MRIIPRKPPLTGEDPDPNQNANLHQKKEENGPGEELTKAFRGASVVSRWTIPADTLDPEEPCDAPFGTLIIRHTFSEACAGDPVAGSWSGLHSQGA